MTIGIDTLWIKEMRLKDEHHDQFWLDPLIIDGTLNQLYFQTQPTAASTERIWTEKEKDLLIAGIKEYGIGHFKEISQAFLPDWSANELRIKTVRLIGRQNLSLYKDWKGDASDIAKEYKRNKEIGIRLGQWKSSVLVYDDEGLVLKAISDSL